MVLASAGIAAGPLLADRQFSLCSAGETAACTLNIPAITAPGTISLGLSAERQTGALKAGSVIAAASSIGVAAPLGGSFQLKV